MFRAEERDAMFQMGLRQIAASELRVSVNGLVFVLRGDPVLAVERFFTQLAGLPRILKAVA